MIVKQVLKEDVLTLPEVKNILDNIREEREAEGKELGYELRKAISHAESFSKISPEKSRELVNELLKLEKMKPEIAIRIADVLPLSNDEIRTIYAKERYTLSEEELKQILELVVKFE
ncbi:MAG: RNA polymerase Rpb4 family protein [Euryarchaeota archaeon]|nr:RNA polymerase Rpb4 family protein [Euryarchaeota archaeon]MBU4138911.1 RNA polymerase Rpb4 family protein [Euryarchaeota archaeon]